METIGRPLLRRGAFARSGEQFLPIAGQGDIPGVDELAAVFRETSLHCNGVIDLHGVSGPTRPHQAVWTSQFDSPVRGLTGLLIFDVDVEEGMRILPLHLCHFAGKRYGLLCIVFRGERMMGNGCTDSDQ